MTHPSSINSAKSDALYGAVARRTLMPQRLPHTVTQADRRNLRVIGCEFADPGETSSIAASSVFNALVAGLDEHEAVTIRYRVPADAFGAVGMEFEVSRTTADGVAHLGSLDTHAYALATWIGLAAPGLIVAPQEPSRLLDLAWNGRIHPMPAALPQRLPALGTALRLHLANSATVALGVNLRPALPPEIQLEACLAALANLHKAAVLSIVVSRANLQAAALRALDDVVMAARRSLYLPDADPSHRRDAVYLLDLATQLRQATCGYRCQLHLQLASEPEPGLLNLLARLFYGGPAADPGHTAAFDFVDVWPVGSPLPCLVPPIGARKRLGIGSEVRPCVRRLSAEGLILGTTASGDCVRISERDQARHVYCIGATGVGKSTLLARLVSQEIASGRGVILVDPHGDLFEEVRQDLPATAAARAVVADAGDTANPFGLNILELQGGDPAIERNLVCNGAVAELVGI